jgi:hypothetical protein
MPCTLPSTTKSSLKRATQTAPRFLCLTKQLPWCIPVRVDEPTANQRPFRHVSQTYAVNVDGALLALDAKVKRGQALLLVNATTEEGRERRVV